MSKIIDIGTTIGSQYSKEGDKKGFLRFRIQKKVIVDNKICQVNGTVTEIKGQ